MRKHIAIVGASGVVGERMFSLLMERGFEQDSLSLFASDKQGRFLEHEGEKYPILPTSQADFSKIDLAFFTAGSEATKAYAEKATSNGCLVIDNTNEFRMRADVPLIVPQVNLDHLAGVPESLIIANPNCSTIPLVRALQCLDQEFGINEAVVSTYQAVSGAGKAGISELMNGAKAALTDQDYIPRTFEAGIAFDLIPRIDSDLETGSTVEELKMRQESRKILGRPDLKVLTTCVRVPVANCHSEAVCLEFTRDVSRDEVIDVLSKVDEMTLYTGMGRASYPQTRDVDGSHSVHIGRIRVDNEEKNKLLFWLVSDNLLIGAALNAVQIAEGMREREWL